jgi:hypothetical protein
METPEFLNNIDWSLLRSQKRELLELTKEASDNNLTGIVYLIDAIQDYAVDEMGINPVLVYDFELEETRG